MAESKKSTSKSKTATKRTTTAGTKKESPKAKAKVEKPKNQAARTQTTNGNSGAKSGDQENKTTQDSEQNIGDKLTGMAQKVFDALKYGAEKVSDYASETSHLTKLKIEISNIKAERKKVFAQMGDRLWQLHKTNKVDKVEESFKADFDRIKSLENQISAKEREIDSITKISTN
jgi:hypothetical protein